MKTTAEKLLSKYSEELGVINPLTLEDLIGSHRRLRAQNSRTHEELQNEIAAAREAARQDAISYDLISIEKIKTMTLQELIQLLESR